MGMANTYTQIYIHIVFAVEGRQSLIAPQHNDELQKYITGIVSAQRHKLIAVNNMPDHLHLLVGVRPDASLSDLVRDIKASSLVDGNTVSLRGLLFMSAPNPVLVSDKVRKR